jgi:hypothetical protein
MSPTAPLAQRQDVFVSSVDLRSGGYLKPFGVKDYYRFIKDPRWPQPVVDDGGRRIYARAAIDQFLRRVAEEGFAPEGSAPTAPPTGHSGGPPLDDERMDRAPNRHPRRKATPPHRKRAAQRPPEVESAKHLPKRHSLMRNDERRAAP